MPSGRFSQLRMLQTIACVGAILFGLALVGLALMGYGDSPKLWMVSAGLFFVFLACVALILTPLLLKAESTLSRHLTVARDLSEALSSQAAALKEIAGNTRISDVAKSLARRDEELDALRSAIREDLRTENWDAALYLIDEIERRFGCKDEADRCREELDDARAERVEAWLQEAIQIVEGHFQSFDWTRAQGEIDRLKSALPDNPRVLGLEDQMRSLKEKHKDELIASWDEAVRKSDTDHAIDILKELDQYLSPSEARSLQNSARDVFKEKLLQLGVQFQLAVRDHRWQDALETGLELIRDFPNARMASEVREVLDTLRERARQGEAAGQPAGS